MTDDKLLAFIIGGCLMLIILPICFAPVFITGFEYPTGEGQHTGYVTAVETTGVIWKTDTIYFKTDTESTQEDTYCVQDKELFTELQKVSKKKELVTIHFHDYLFKGLIKCNGEIAIADNIIPNL